MMTVLKWNVGTQHEGVARSRDVVQVSMIVGSFINELRVVLERHEGAKSRLWDLADKGVRAGLIGGLLPDVR